MFLLKLINNLNLNQRSISIVGVVLLLGVIWYFNAQPWRNATNYCNTFKSEGQKLHKKWAEQSGNYSKSDDITKMIGAIGLVASAPQDLADFFDKLAKVSPKEIEPDVIRLRDASKKQADIMQDTAAEIAGGNFLGGAMKGFGSSIMLGFSTKGAEDRINAYTKANCNVADFNDLDTASNNPTVAAQEDLTAKIWDSNVHGILAYRIQSGKYISDPDPTAIVLLDPNSYEVLAEKTMPSATQVTSDGKNFTVFIKDDNEYHSHDYRYYPAVFNRESDGSKHIGIYDLKTSTIIDITEQAKDNGFSAHVIEDTEPFFSTSNHDLLNFKRDGKPYSYSISSGKIQPSASNSSDEATGNNRIISRFFVRGATASSGLPIDLYLFSETLLAGHDISICGQFNGVCAPDEDHAFGFDCFDYAQLPSKDVVCAHSGQLFKVTMSSAQEITVNNCTAGPCVSEPAYAITMPEPLLPKNERKNSNVVASPDGKTLIFQSTLGNLSSIYSVSASGGEPKEIKKLEGSESYSPLLWR